ncbi:MAG: hypothetical protein COZ06_32580 [Armatimonadetes bacterium CG_4_10_14_3_um_filter_66_18]|nr:hypothetical protein [Armatimonadota bacterium]OIO95387.1 MAG: hypothetical protein AUJ96_26800 [Armatimonadetes bacterium CG2_30_66_41]PIU91847.1 MAG: hypothetical protein COS65_20480 [Armatimonadetes bacterium CG06_land_8_20_14_3_00_66_21]PIX46783.1 MAG: hypothetical protein COZ57_10310 [Armatimonadetes bacterium CG_4_8_14_3_um_filter_66_20]PIY37575.1 MAG: hypothetical protein COZ06_32580 [Armatimonadetes bacterium CG_4_10_14_3_um_filter_66_18]PIZ47767.1 MAG: hypothetical protein COY42_07
MEARRACSFAIVAVLSSSAGHSAVPEVVRGLYCNPGPAIDNRIWATYGAGYDEDTAEKHGGRTSLKCVNTTDADAHGAWQTIQFDQDKPRQIVVAGWAKLDGVTGPADYRNSVYLDLRLENGESWPMKIAAFDPAKTGWQYAEEVYTPPAALESARVYAFLRERKGTAWFDDLYVGEILDDQGTRSRNLLKDPGLEGALSGEASYRDQFYAELAELGCNAFHFYKGVSWETVMGDDATKVPEGLPTLDPKDPLLDFVQDAHRRRFKVWLTVGLGLPQLENVKSPEFPFYPCVNNRWGTAYTRAIGYFAQYGFDGVGMVPDEWNYNNGAVSGWSKHADPEVAKFYAELPEQCDCPPCRTRFREQTGHEYPDVKHLWSTAEPVWAEYLKFRYDSTAAWIRRSVDAAKRVNPEVVTDTMICVLPVCSDDRRSTGAAWDQLGIESGLDCLQTDPYIFLHNYLGDSTHYYPTETAIHLSAANWKGTAGVTLEACRLYDRYRNKEPVEVYGTALSCLAHGATEFFWWHLNYLLGQSKFVEPGPPTRQLAATYQVMKAMEPALVKTRVPGELLVLYSRASEDAWHWLAGKGVLPKLVGEKPNPKRGFVAHRNVLTWLLRRGYPFQTTFLDNPDPARIKAAKLLIVPFPFSLKESEVEAVEQQATAGKTVVLMSELSPVDQLGQPVAAPRLARLFGSRPLDPSAEGATEVAVGRGKVVFLGGDFAVRLFADTPPMKDPKGVVPLLAFDSLRTSLLEKHLAHSVPGSLDSLFAAQPVQDVETTLLEGGGTRLLLLTNWDTTDHAQVGIPRSRLRGSKRVDGYAILRDGTVSRLREACTGEPWTVNLAPQETRLLRLLP